MAENENGQERTEEATPRRRQRAFSEGKVPRSQEFSAAMMLLGAVTLLVLGAGAALGRSLRQVLQAGAQYIAIGPGFEEATATALLRSVGTKAFIGAAPMVLGVAGVALAVNALQARGVFSGEPIKPKLSHLSPLQGIKRIVSIQSLVNLLKSLIKLAVLIVVSYFSVAKAWPLITSLSGHDPASIVAVMMSLTLKLAATAGAAFLALAGLDYLFQVYQHGKGLRMTRQDVVQEYKETEGDPLIKSRIKSIALAMSRKRMLKDVETADVIITNPTRLAIALKYDIERSGAPIVLAMGARKLAARIREIARKSGVPVIENKPLAQALYHTAQVGQPIPPALYLAVAEVLAFVYQSRNGKPAGSHTGRGVKR
jgi:flagellar biosynthetic protein FlhB